MADNTKNERRVAITGIGAITPLGLTFTSSWEAFLEGRSAIREIERFGGLPWKHGGAVWGFEPGVLKDTRRYDPFALFALAAAREAVADAGLERPGLKGAGIVLGSGRGGIQTLEEAARKHPTAYTMAGTTVSMAASLAASRLGIKGHVSGVSCACASGSAAIGTALDLVRSGRLDIVLAGGAEAPLAPLCIKGYGRSGALSKTGKLRPFAPERDGFVLGEGAAVLVLEELGRTGRTYTLNWPDTATPQMQGTPPGPTLRARPGPLRPPSRTRAWQLGTWASSWRTPPPPPWETRQRQMPLSWSLEGMSRPFAPQKQPQATCWPQAEPLRPRSRPRPSPTACSFPLQAALLPSSR